MKMVSCSFNKDSTRHYKGMDLQRAERMFWEIKVLGK